MRLLVLPDSCLAAVTGFARYYRRSPDQMSDAELRTYPLHLVRKPFTADDRPSEPIDASD